jgi:hypothetical protein
MIEIVIVEIKIPALRRNIGANSKLFNTLNLNGIFERKNNDKRIDHNSALAPSNLTTDQNGILSSSNDKNPCTKLVTVCSTKKTFMSKAL